MQPLKVLLIGPKECGKTTVANFLQENKEPAPERQYKPTKGVRILETELDLGRNSVPIELWDCSGDQCYESCWPAIMKDADGVILMYNPENRSQEHEATLWFEWFIQNLGLDAEQCLIMAHSMSDRASKSGKLKLPVNIHTINTDMDNIQSVREEFDEYIGNLDQFVSKSRK